MVPRLILQFLGLPQVYLDDKLISTDRRKAIALLSYLAVNDIGKIHQKYSRESLSALFWPDYEQSKAFSNLRRVIWEVHQAIGEGYLIAEREAVSLNPKVEIDLDVAHFQDLLSQSHQQSDVSLRTSLLTESVKLYRDHFLTGFTVKDAPNFNEWAFAESESLKQNLAEALTTLAKDHCALGQAEQAIPYARRLVTLDLLNEASYRQLMEVYWQAGQHSAALKQFQTLEQTLRKELNLDPQPETLALYKKIRKGEINPVQRKEPTEKNNLVEDIGKPLPSGTVTFLFTDIEGSTKLAQEYPATILTLLARHHEILRQSLQAHNGYVFQIVGDSFAVAFHSASDAVQAALDAQRSLNHEAWSPTPIKVRMGIHTGTAYLNDPSAPTVYSGYATIAATQRIMSAGHGGQILLSGATNELVYDMLPADVELVDLGEKNLKDLMRPTHLYQLNAAGLTTTFPPLKVWDLFPNNLPAQLSTFIGREKEVEQIKKRLEKNRLVTLTGSGGVGKTRLSIQVASELLESYPHGVWLVELAPLTDPALVTKAVCNTLDITLLGNTAPLTVLTEYLRSKKLLLVVDNCEHLIDECAHLCDSLLHACPDLCILASSREALGIEGENAYRVPSLSLPDPTSRLAAIQESEAVKLFVERATAILPEFEITESNASSIAQICKRLDGIALAIELAASRVKILKVEQIASRLDDVFRLLTGGSRTALPRQQTLRALIDWSYNLLSEAERVVLRRLSVFMGGWTLEAAEAVCDNPNMLDLLTHLVDKSLVAVDLEHGDESRYYLLETIRQYAREKLAEHGESVSIRNRHMEYFCQLVERFEPGLRGPDQVALLDSLERELDNLRSALEWSLDHAVVSGLQLASGLKWFWHLLSNWNEGAGWLEKLLHVEAETRSFRPDSESDVFYRAKALLALTLFAYMLGEIQKAKVAVAESLVLCEKMDRTDYTPLIAEGYSSLGVGALHSGDINQAKSLAEKSLELYQRCGDKFGIAEVQMMLLTIAAHSGDLETARLFAESNLAMREELGDKDGVAFGLNLAGGLAIAQGDYDRAQKLLSAGVEKYREAKNAHMQGGSLANLGIVYFFKGEMDLAREYFLQAAKLAQQKWNPVLKAVSIYWLALYGFEQKQFRKFILLNSFLENEESIHSYLTFLPLNSQTTLQRNVAAARAELGEDEFHRAEADGKAMTLDQALAYALEGIDE